MFGRRRARVLAASSILLCACFGTYVPPQDTESSGTSGVTPPATSSSTSTGPSSSTSGTATDPSTSTADTTGAPSCEHVDFLFMVDAGMDPAYNELLMTTIVSNATNITTWLGDLDSIHFGLTTTASVQANMADPECMEPGSLIQPAGFPTCPDRPFIDNVDDLNNLVQCFGPALTTPAPDGEVSSPIVSLISALDPVANGPGGCNEGFHDAGDPIVLIIFTDSDDGSMTNLAAAAGAVFLQEGLPPSAVALVVIAGPIDGCDGEGGDGGEPITCGVDELPLEAACRLDGFSRYMLDDQGLADNSEFWNLCDAQQDDAVLLEALEMGFTQLVPRVCSAVM